MYVCIYVCMYVCVYVCVCMWHDPHVHGVGGERESVSMCVCMQLGVLSIINKAMKTIFHQRGVNKY